MGNLRKYVSSDASQEMIDTMKSQIHGLIRDVHHVSYVSMIRECKDQVDECSDFCDFVLSILIDDILNQLIRENKITLESLLDDENGRIHIAFRIVV